MPPPFQWPDEDAWLADTHWAYDLGAAELTRELAAALSTTAVLSRFSRLLIDPNRTEEATDLFRIVAEGKPVLLNRGMDDAERERRVALGNAYHSTIDALLGPDTAKLVLSVHSFTPLYEGVKRTVEMGVLFDREEVLAERVRAALTLAGINALPNEPYSGKLGLMYSAERHAARHRRRALELEVRQDLACDRRARARIVAVLAAVLADALPP
jgi:predicted N-formylglutamate amidohydrolase